jgi:hypothetical protein
MCCSGPMQLGLCTFRQSGGQAPVNSFGEKAVSFGRVRQLFHLAAKRLIKRFTGIFLDSLLRRVASFFYAPQIDGHSDPAPGLRPSTLCESEKRALKSNI